MPTLYFCSRNGLRFLRLEIRELKSGALIRIHTRADRPGTVVLPLEERIFNPSRETHRILAQAKAIGVATHKLCLTLFEREGRVGQRKLWGIVGLAKRCPKRLIEMACERSMSEGMYSYTHVKTLTEQLVSEALRLLDEPVAAQQSLTQSHALIRDGSDYADLFTLGANHCATLPELATQQTQTQTETTL